MTQHKKHQAVTREVITRITCDHCGKSSPPDERSGWTPHGWHHFDTHHGEWGADSIESYDYYDACSGRCFLQLLAKLHGDATESYRGEPPRSYELADMSYSFVTSLLVEIGVVEE